MRKKIFENPLIKDRITVLKTSEDTNGEYTLLQIDLLVGGGNMLHYHTSFEEEFTAIDGELGLVQGKQQIILKPGEHKLIRRGQLHRFFNPGKTNIRFQVKFLPAQENFLDCLAITYGLAADGLTNKEGIPKKLDHLAFLLEHSDTRFKGWLGIITPFMLRRAKSARKRGVDRYLIDKYCSA
jgi:mannose-6-phosphate isomerase-like protein (cupin superfamily)